MININETHVNRVLTPYKPITYKLFIAFTTNFPNSIYLLYAINNLQKYPYAAFPRAEIRTFLPQLAILSAILKYHLLCILPLLSITSPYLAPLKQI